ncbi:MAG: prepilin-type N-terminal cleavage/methylation domain-containing protein [Phycisphaerales bacterium]
MIRSSRQHAGFSLIEVLIAIVVLAFGLIGLAAVFPAVIKQQQDATARRIQDYSQEAIRDMFNRVSEDLIDWRFLSWDPFMSPGNLGSNCVCDSQTSFDLVSVFGTGCPSLDARCHPQSIAPVVHTGIWEEDWEWPQLGNIEGSNSISEIYQRSGTLYVGNGSIVLCNRKIRLATQFASFDTSGALDQNGDPIGNGILEGDEIAAALTDRYLFNRPVGCEPGGDVNGNGVIDVAPNSQDWVFEINSRTVNGVVEFDSWVWDDPIFVEIADITGSDSTALTTFARIYPEPYAETSDPAFVWDFVPRKLSSGALEAAVFVRRIDPEIPIPPGSSLSDVLVNATREGARVVLPVAETEGGIPTFNGSGRYSTIRKRQFTLSDDNASLLILDPAADTEAVYIAQVGQKLIDEGSSALVQTVEEVTIREGIYFVTLNPGYGEVMQGESLTFLYTPQLAVDAFITSIPCGGN